MFAFITMVMSEEQQNQRPMDLLMSINKFTTFEAGSTIQ